MQARFCVMNRMWSLKTQKIRRKTKQYKKSNRKRIRKNWRFQLRLFQPNPRVLHLISVLIVYVIDSLAHVAFILSSGLTVKQQQQLKSLCSVTKSQFLVQYPLISEVYHKPTHLVIGVDEKKFCRRTLKYLTALSEYLICYDVVDDDSSSIWIVDMNWVADSLSAGRLVEETKYEIEGDLKTQKGGIPKQSRNYPINHENHRLFYSWIFRLDSSYSPKSPPVASIRDMIQRMEGVALTDPNEFEQYQDKDSNQYTRVVLKEDIEYQLYVCFYGLYYLFYSVDGVHHVSVAWLLDCIGSYSILPF